MDMDVEVDVDIDRYFCCSKEVSKSVLVLFHGIEAVLVLTLIIASPVSLDLWEFLPLRSTMPGNLIAIHDLRAGASYVDIYICCNYVHMNMCIGI